jgi:hypothetical protein
VTTCSELDIDEALFAQHEWLAKDRTYREAMIPARELNRYPVRRSTKVRSTSCAGGASVRTSGQGHSNPALGME